MSIASNPAIRCTNQQDRAGHAAQCPQRPRPPDAPRDRNESGCAAKHGAIIQTHAHFVEQMLIGDAEQSSRAWRLQWNEGEPAASERVPEAAQHGATELALVVVIDSGHHSVLQRDGGHHSVLSSVMAAITQSSPA
jgi:hypothetical protein